MNIVFDEHEGYKVEVNADEKLDFAAVEKEVGKADFSVISAFDGSVIMTAEEAREALIEYKKIDEEDTETEKDIMIQYKRTADGEIYTLRFARSGNGWEWNGVAPSLFVIDVDNDETFREEYLTDDEFETWQPEF